MLLFNIWYSFHCSLHNPILFCRKTLNLSSLYKHYCKCIIAEFAFSAYLLKFKANKLNILFYSKNDVKIDLSLLSLVSCLQSHVSGLLSHVSCLTSPVSLLLSHVSCLMSHVACLTSPVLYLLSHVSCLLSDVSCLMSPFSWLTSPV